MFFSGISKTTIMTRNHLETYVEIVSLISQAGPLKLTQIMYNTTLSYIELKEHLSFLVKQAFVEERTIVKHNVVFGVTQRGINVLKYFQVHKQTIPIVLQETQFTLNLPSNHGYSGVQEQLFDFS